MSKRPYVAITVAELKNAKPLEKPYKISVGYGLFLLVQSNGSKYWRMSYRFAGKQKTLAIGVFPEIGLADAKDVCFGARKLLATDVDPMRQKRHVKRHSLRK